MEGTVDSVPPGKGCDVLDGELTHEQRDKIGSENVAYNDSAQILLKWGGGVIIKCYEWWKISKIAIWPPYN